MQTPETKPDVAQRSLVISIFGSHWKRIGFVRTAIGGGAMYLTLPLFMFLHVTITVFMYRFLLAPLLKLPRLPAKDYIIIDRHRIEGLHWFDKLNCWFCGYANGIITLMNDELDKLADTDNKAPLWARPFVALYIVVNVVFLFLGLLMTTGVLWVIARALGLHRGSLRRIKIQLLAESYGARHHPMHRKLIIFYKMVAMVIGYNLEQIESAWCPLKHIEKSSHVLPAHHERFIARDNLGGMKEILITDGTVSPKKPKW